jgi:cell division protein FtsB
MLIALFFLFVFFYLIGYAAGNIHQIDKQKETLLQLNKQLEDINKLLKQ